MPNERVALAASVARYILAEARNLYRFGVGEDINGDTVGLTAGELDNIPADSETYRWAHACVSFVRYIAHLMAQELHDELGNRMITDPFDDITDENT